MKHKCPPHWWLIDSEGIGHCKYCGAVKDFGKAIRRQQEEENKISSRGGLKARGVLRKPRGKRSKAGRPSKYE